MQEPRAILANLKDQSWTLSKLVLVGLTLWGLKLLVEYRFVLRTLLCQAGGVNTSLLDDQDQQDDQSPHRTDQNGQEREQ